MKENQRHEPTEDYFHLEDLAMKTAAQYFGEELLYYLGVEQKAVAIVPTESVHLEARKMFQDFNYELEDGTWLHLEFESDPIQIADLKRFREYEVATSRTYQVPVITCVICTARVGQIRSELTEGLNTYRVKTVHLKEEDADVIFDGLYEKIGKRETLKKEDLLPMLLSPLMGGTMPNKERIRESIVILSKPGAEVDKEELIKMQAVLYALANKLLDDMDLQEIKEVMAMTRLGQMLMEDGIEKGMERGIERGVEQGLDRVNTLNAKLAEAGRTEDIIRASKDKQYQQLLFEEFGI